MAMRRYSHAMRHQWVHDMRIGTLYPFFLQEVTPGDTWRGHTSSLFRLAPMDVPAFAALNLHTYFFYVPHRILWSDFEDVITGASAAAWPTVGIPDSVASSTYDLMKHYGLGGVNSGVAPYAINALPFRAYNKVWNEFFRDQSIDSEVSEDSTTLQGIKFSAADYFGGARDEVQQGTAETIDTSGGNFAVTTLRDAQHRQKFRERRSQFGERYYDLLAAQGINVPDSRLDRPEFVARGRGTIGISEVVASATSASENTGEYRGHGIAGLNTPFRKRMFVEHGILLGLVCCRPRLQIGARIDRIFLTNGKDDLFQPELQSDTQVSIKLGEVRSESVNLDNVWAYTARDEWLRNARDTVGGQFRESQYAPWTVQRAFSSDPSITDVQTVAEFENLFQDQTAGVPQIYAYHDHNIGKRSQIPKRRFI